MWTSISYEAERRHKYVSTGNLPVDYAEYCKLARQGQRERPCEHSGVCCSCDCGIYVLRSDVLRQRQKPDPALDEGEDRCRNQWQHGFLVNCRSRDPERGRPSFPLAGGEPRTTVVAAEEGKKDSHCSVMTRPKPGFDWNGIIFVRDRR
jgi:hypothetical protein